MDDTETPRRMPATKMKQVPLPAMIIGCVLSALIFFALGTRANTLPGVLRQAVGSNLDYSSLNELYAMINAKYDGTVDTGKLIDGAKHGMVDALGDPHTTYFNAEEAKQFSDDLNGTFEGIGAELGKTDGKLTILSVLSDSPAQKQGLKAKDVILKINDEDASSLSTGAAVTKIRGTKGTTVKLSIFRDSALQDYTITRDTITSPSVVTETLENGTIGYLRITRFGDDTTRLARKAADDFKAKGISKIILDLRGNGGGLLVSAKDISSLWLNNKVIVSERTNGIVTDTLRSGSNPTLGGVKTVVLVDGGSASASEIVAGALKDNDAATLIGEKTYGKGSVQTVERLSTGGQLKVTIAKWYTPKGVNIDKEGILPDREVKLTDDDVKNGRDPQENAALDALK